MPLFNRRMRNKCKQMWKNTKRDMPRHHQGIKVWGWCGGGNEIVAWDQTKGFAHPTLLGSHQLSTYLLIISTTLPIIALAKGFLTLLH